MRYKLVLWDFDGTLADTLRAGLEIYNALAIEHGVEPITNPAAVREMTARQFAKSHKIPWLKVPHLFRHYLAMQKSGIERVNLFPGVSQLLLALRTHGCRLGVVSSNTEHSIRVCLTRAGVNDCFQHVVGYSRLFGKERALRQMILREATPASRVLYIGDEVRDIEAANKARIDIAAVTWGFNSAAALQKHDPTYLVESPEGLASCLDLHAPNHDVMGA